MILLKNFDENTKNDLICSFHDFIAILISTPKSTKHNLHSSKKNTTKSIIVKLFQYHFGIIVWF